MLVKIFLNTSSEEQLAIALFHPRYLIKIFLCLVGFIRLLAPLAAPVCIPSLGGLGDEGSGCFCSPASCRVSVAKAKAQILAFQGSCLGAGADLLAASSSTGSREHRTDLAGELLSWECCPATIAPLWGFSSVHECSKSLRGLPLLQENRQLRVVRIPPAVIL